MRGRRSVAAVSALLLPAASALGKVTSAKSLVKGIGDEFNDVAGTVVDVVCVVIGLASIVMLVMVVIESHRSGQNSKDKFLTWFGVLVVSIIALEIIKAYFF